MTSLLLTLQLAVLPLSALVAATLPPLVMARRGRWSVTPLLLWALALFMLVFWLRAGYQSGVSADENGTVGNIYDGLQWLLNAVLLAGAAVAVCMRGSVSQKKRATAA